MTSRKAYVENTGCISNKLTLMRVIKYLTENDWEIVDEIKDADIVIFNTCAFSDYSEKTCINRIIEITPQMNEGSQLVVMGCLPKINLKKLREVFKGPVIGPNEIEKIDEIIKPKKTILDVEEGNIISSLCDDRLGSGFLTFFNKFPYKTNAEICNNFIKISTGCLGNCTYCAIKNAKGKVKSKPPEKIVGELKQILSSGEGHIIGLISDDCGAYGLDISTTYPKLMNEILSVEGDYDLVVGWVNPDHMIRYEAEIIPLLRSEKIKQITVPIQSGSDTVLERMKRPYKISDVMKTLEKIKEINPKIDIYTQFIIGFPGETEEEFRQTLEVIDRWGHIFGLVVVNRFTPRPDTEAWSMDGAISKMEIRKRYLRLKLHILKSYVGKLLKRI